MAYKITEDLIDEIHNRLDLVDIISRYVDLKKSGNNYIGLCPFHNEKTPSFTVSNSKQLFHCFGCGEGGDVINFIMKIENLSFVEAVKFIADLEGIALEENKTDYKLKQDKEILYRINREAARFFYNNLINNETALKYLHNRRISNKTITRFGIGYALNSWDASKVYLEGKGFKATDIVKAGLLGIRKDKTGYYDIFRNRIIFPIINTRNKVIGFGARAIDESMPKYLNSKDSLIFTKGNNLYGLNFLKRTSKEDKIILVEGYMDVLALYENGINSGVASLGTAFTINQAKQLKRYNKKIYLCYDSDTAGVNATNKALDILKKEGINPRVILLPRGKDPDDFITTEGLEKFNELIRKALNFIDYKIFISKQRYDLKKMEDKIQFTKDISKILKMVKSPIEKELYINKISKEIGVSKEAIENELLDKNFTTNRNIYRDKYISGKNRYNKNKIIPIKIILEPAHLTAEKTLIRLMIENRDYYEVIKNFLDKDEFLNYDHNKLVKLIFTEYESNKNLGKLTRTILKNRIKEKDLDCQILEDIFNINMGALPEDKDGLIDNLINRINYYKLKLERKNILQELQKIEAKDEEKGSGKKRYDELGFKLVKLDKLLKSYIDKD